MSLSACLVLEIELAAIGRISELRDVLGELHGGGLKAQADAEVGHPALPREANRVHHSAHAAFAESTRHEHTADGGKHFLRVFPGLEALRFDPLDVDAQIVGQTRRERAPR